MQFPKMKHTAKNALLVDTLIHMAMDQNAKVALQVGIPMNLKLHCAKVIKLVRLESMARCLILNRGFVITALWVKLQ